MKLIQNKQLLKEKLEEYQIVNIFETSNFRSFQLQRYEKDEIIALEGTELESLLFLVEGNAKVTSSVETGKALLLRFIKPLSIIGDIELIQGIPVQSQVTAVTDCLMLSLNIKYIKQNEMNNPTFLQILLQHLSYKLQTCTTASRINLLASVESKFASYLLTTLVPIPENKFGHEIQTENIKEIADLLGTTYRHLNRVIQSLTQQKIIEKDKNSIQILDFHTLEKISNGIRYE